MKVPSVLYIVSDIDKSLGLEWTARELQKAGYQTIWVLLNKGGSHLETYLKQLSIAVYRIPYTGKKDIPVAVIKIARIIKRIDPGIVHTHLFDAAICGLFAAKLMKVKKRILTRHHSTFHHTYFPRAVYYDRLITSLSTHVIAVSENVRQVMVEKENVPEEKITVCHHGFDFGYFQSVQESDIEMLRKRYALAGHHPVVGVISRYLELKGIQYIIPAFRELLRKHPNAKLLLANSRGSYSAEIKKMLTQLPVASFVEIPFENNLNALYQCMDIFLHCPVDGQVEAFGQTYVEALIMNIPSVFTLSGVANEFIEDGHNAMVVPFRNSEAIHAAMEKLIGSPEIAATISANGYQDVSSKFKLGNMIDCLHRIYTA